MILYPKDIKERLEFTRVIESIQTECLSLPGKRYFDSLPVLTDIQLITQLLDESDEYKKSLQRSEQIPLSSFESVIQDVALLRKEGYVLEIESIRKIYRIVSIGTELRNYFSNPEKAKIHPLISTIVSAIIMDGALTKEIDRVLDQEGEVRPDASEALLKISKQIRNKERELDKIFNAELESLRIKGLLSENGESIRNGRRVITVAAEHKRKVAGIIHDESTTGKTVYIEPENVIPLNHEIYNLYAERRHEIYRIIRELCAFIRPYADSLLTTEHVLTKLDTIRAKARFALRIKAGRPKLQEQPTFQFKEAYSPSLLLRYENEPGRVVPFDLVLHGQNRMLVLSGPNAGGKSVTMKSVGLLQLMIQSGIPVPVDENSVFGIFHKCMADIGDQQSIDDDLSTYSSHLQNMKYMTEEADARSLILIDEFGSGTDPKIGGAIAEAVLHYLDKKHVFGVVTTHYSNLKYFAFRTRNIVNGSMEFDTEKLLPTFRLQVGKPGSSFAFEIASKTGLPAQVLKYARHKTGKNEKAIDDMLVTLMAEKKEYEDKMASLIEKQDKLDRLIKSYEHMHADMEVRKKKLKLQSKEQVAIQVMERQKEAERLLKEIKKAESEAKAKQALEALKAEQEKALRELHTAKVEVFEEEVRKEDVLKPEVGSFVRMRSGSSIGKILKIQKNMAEVEMGMMQVKIPLIDLVVTKEPIQTYKKSVNTDMVSGMQRPETKIDLREYTKSDALHFLQEFLDRALLNNLHELKIIHGVGTGVLKKEVHKMLREYKDIKKVWHPEPELGGEGVTYVQL